MTTKFQVQGSERISTGIRNTTIFNPAYSTGVPFEGDPKNYSFNSIQRKNYDQLAAVLERNKLKFTYIGACDREGERDYLNRNKPGKITLTSFVAIAAGFVWEKYEGYCAGGGQNRVYVAGQMMKTTQFLKLTAEQQDALFGN